MSDDDPADLAVILAARRQEFLRFVQKRVGDVATAEDILQDALSRTLTAGTELRDRSAAEAWFYRLLRSRIIDHHRRAGAAARRLAVLEHEPAEASPSPPGQPCGCVTGLHGEMKAEYRAALQRIEVEGASVKEFAVEAGITAANAGVRVFRAREALKKSVTRKCGACAANGCTDCTCAAPQ